MEFLLGWPIFRGKLLVSGSVNQQKHIETVMMTEPLFLEVLWGRKKFMRWNHLKVELWKERIRARNISKFFKINLIWWKALGWGRRCWSAVGGLYSFVV